ncbi:hypothetical protein GJ496_004953 [Pomphorhynchus laevis]|nr:hypothetical protein GJ496_004953 [Pomphorhynchus laevis]
MIGINNNSNQPQQDNPTPFSPLMLKSSKRIARRGHPPDIIKPLKAREIKQGEPLRIECFIKADPEVEYQWTKNNIPIRETDRVDYGKSSDGHLYLSIKSCRLEDSGVYMIVAKNSFGMAKISCQILVTSVDNRDLKDMYSRKAVFLQYPKDQKIVLNGTAEIIFELKIFLDTKIVWLLNGSPLKATTRIKTDFDGRYARLTIQNFKIEDCGLYTLMCISGEEESSCDVFLTADGSTLTRENSQFLQQSIKRKLEPSTHSPYLERTLKPVQGKIVRLETIAPLFTKTMSNISTKVGRDVQFVASVKGYPKPKLSLIFRGLPVDEMSDKYVIDFDDVTGIISITIKNVIDSDFGTYTLKVDNNLGEVSCSARMMKAETEAEITLSSLDKIPSLSSATIPFEPSIVQPGIYTASFIDWKSFEHLESKQQRDDEITEIQTDKEKPTLHIPLQNCSVQEGEVIILWAKIYSTSIPQLIWLKDDGPIVQSSRINITFDKVEGKAELRIFSAVQRDSGTYALVIQNQKGIITTHANVQVNITPNIDYTAFVSPDRFTELDAQKPSDSGIEYSGVDDTSCVPNISELINLDKIDKNAISQLHKIQEPENKLSFIKELVDANIKEGESVTMQASLSAYPIPKCIWYHNGIEISVGSRYHTNFNPFNQIAFLHLNSATMLDSGQYKLVACNIVKSIESISNLTVQPIKGVDLSSKRDRQAYDNLEKSIEYAEYDSGVDSQSYARDIDAIHMIDAEKKRQEIEEFETRPIAPQILTQISDFNVKEGDAATFIAKVVGSPLPQISWTRNSQLLQDSNRIHTKYDIHSKEAILNLSYVKYTDAGTYEICATNQAGSVTSRANLNVTHVKSIEDTPFIKSDAYAQLDREKIVRDDSFLAGVDTSSFVEPSKFESFDVKPIYTHEIIDDTSGYMKPVFDASLQEVLKAKEGSVIQLITVVSGNPIPELEWNRNGSLLPSSNRIQQDYNLGSKLCCLTINHAILQDAGKYTLIAKNAIGQSSTECSLIVESTASIDTNPMIPTNIFYDIEHKPVKVLDVIPGVDSSSMFNQQLFEALDKDRQTHLIKVHELEKVMPYIISQLSDCLISEGNDICLSCQIFGMPIPEITWSKDGRSIQASSRIVLYYDILNKTAYLWIKKCTLGDMGNYRIDASNEIGKISSECSVKVQQFGKAVDDSFFVAPERFQALEKYQDDKFASITSGVDNTGFLSDQSKIIELETPNVRFIEEPVEVAQPLAFVKQLEDIKVKEYEPLILQVTITGNPVDSIDWKLNNSIILASNNISPEYDAFNRIAKLKVKSTNSKMHSGEYNVSISNKLGCIQSKCVVDVQIASNIDDKTDRELGKYETLEVQIIPRDFGESGIDKRPYTHNLEKLLMLDVFVKPEMEEVAIKYVHPVFTGKVYVSQSQINELDNIVMAVHVDGFPIPTFYWMKDGHSLLYSNRFAMHYNILDKTLYLYIQGICLFDAGVYYAVAENAAGSAVSSNLVLTVNPIDTIDKSANKPIELFTKLDSDKIIRKDVDEPGVDTKSNYTGDLQNLFGLDQKSPLFYDVIPGVDTSCFKDINLYTDLEKPRYISAMTSKDIRTQCKPEFQSKLTGTDVIHGHNALVSVMVTGWPFPSILWYKDGKLVSLSNRVSAGYDAFSKVASLLIKSSRPSDSGKYTIACSNPLGKIEDSTNINILRDAFIDTKSLLPNIEPLISELERPKLIPKQYEAGIDQSNYIDFHKLVDLESSRLPKAHIYTSGIDKTALVDNTRFANLEKTPEHKEFVEDKSLFRAPMIMQPLNDVSISEGNDLYLSSVIDGYPIPSFELVKDNQPVESSNRNYSFYDINSKLLYIRIVGTKPSDAGIYTVTATNECGSSRSSASVLIESTPSIDLSTAHPQSIDKLKSFENKVIMHIPESIDVPALPPVFAESSHSVELNEGSNLSVQIQLIQASPMPSFNWTKNKSTMQVANRYFHHYDMQTRILLFKLLHANNNDSGEYIVEAKNIAGIAQFTLFVEVKQIPSIDISWQASKSSKAITQLDENLNRPLPVTIVASTIDSSTYVQDITMFADLDHDKPKKDIVVVERKTKLAPHVNKPLENKTINETEDVVLEIHLNNAYPMCSIQWFRNKMELRASNRVQPTYNLNTGVASLRLLGCQLRDSGQYTIVAKNELGQDTSTCVLSINPVSSIDDTQILAPDRLAQIEKPPHLKEELREHEIALAPIVAMETITKLHDVESEMLKRSQAVLTVKEDEFSELKILKQPKQTIECNDGESIHIQCTVTGKPLPQFIWYRNDVPLHDANRYSSNYDLLTGVISLHIKYAQSELDSASYVLHCIGSNNQRVCSQACSLQVHPTISVDKNQLIASDMGIRTLEKINKQVKERQLLAYSKIQPGVDNQSFVDYDKFTRLEMQDLALVPIVSGVDSSGFVPLDRFTGIERPLPVKIFTSGIDKTPNVSDLSLDQLRSLDEYRFIETYEPLVRTPRLKMLSSPDKEIITSVEGYPVSMFCKVDAYPIPEIEWYHNNKLLDSSQRIISNYDAFSGIVSIHFMSAYLSDSGLYNLKIKNDVGHLDKQVELLVEKTSDIDDTSYIRSSDSYKLKHGALEFAGKENITSVDFVFFPKDRITANLHENVVINYEPVGGANSEVHWMLNNVEITERLKIQVNEAGKCWFVLKDFTNEQSGVYTCVIKNSFGEFSKSFTITTSDDLLSTSAAPTLVEELKSVVVREGDDINLSASFASDIAYDIMWLKDDLPLKENDRVRFSTKDKEMCKLCLDNARKSDGGWYQCVIRNVNGSAITKAKVIVVASDETMTEMSFSPLNLRSVALNSQQDVRSKWIKPEVKKETFDPAKIFFGQLRRDRAAKGTEPLPENISLTADDMYVSTASKPAKLKICLPEFLEFIQDHVYVLQTTVIPIDDPFMKVEWFKNGNIIQSGDRISVMYEMGYASLTIKNAQISDAGSYECVATNKFGSDRSQCLFTCQYTRPIQSESSLSPVALEKLQNLEAFQNFKNHGTPIEISSKQNSEKPTLLMSLQDVEVKERQPTKLIAKFTYTDKTRISWTINGKAILNVSRFNISSDGGISTLSIDPCRSIDNGVVTCIAKNKFGEASTKCELKVIPKSTPAYFDLVMDNAIQINLSADEMTRMQNEFAENIKSNPAFDQAKSDAVNLVKQYVQDLKKKYGELAKKRTTQTHEQPSHEQPSPNFVSELKSSDIMDVDEGQAIALSIRYQPNNCTVTWLHNHATLQNSLDINIHTTSDGRSSLIIPYALQTDTGLYSVKIANNLGSTVSSTNVNVKQLPKDQQASGGLVVVPLIRNAPTGSNAVFTCRSRNKVNWVRLNGKSMPAGRFTIKSSDQYTHQLIIRKVTIDDGGQYGCKIAGKTDKDAILMQLNIIDGDSSDKLSKVIMPLENHMDVSEGSNVTLTCQMPLMQLNEKCKWMKDGKQLHGVIFVPDSIGEEHKLKLYDVQLKDEGIYSATMESSGLKTDCKLNIKKLSTTDEAISKPLISSTIKSLSIIEGQSAKFQFTLNDKTQIPEIQWLKNNQQLKQSEDFDIWYKDGKGMLLVKNAAAEDSGLYTVKILQGKRSATCSAMLTIRRGF